MPTQTYLRRASSLRRRPASRMNFMTVGQCFDIEVRRDVNGWRIEIPEIGASTHARRRATVELAARECIAAETGIPIGYVAIVVANEVG
jgi:hypothetical protein